MAIGLILYCTGVLQQTTSHNTIKMMSPKFYNFLAVVLMLLGLVSAASSIAPAKTTAHVTTTHTTTVVVTKTTHATTKASVTASVTGTNKKKEAATSTSTAKSAGNKVADATLITVSLAAGLVTFGLVLS
ncbi:hypothetical protein PLIIFM63780_006343 [Purpureocillium lilacinum]|nr:hypothetical protein PLIIFM63780_006343 [Purpureocillium lilacinum]